jgi:hypothetical protein
MNTTTNVLDDVQPAKRSEMLNVLTILTFVGCAFALFSAFTTYFGATERYNQAVVNQTKVQSDAPAVVKTLAGPGMVEMARKTMVNKVPIMILELVSVGLCVFGAISMRSLKKRGFFLYLVGELLPTITSLIFIGANVFAGIFIVIGLIISLVFIALYATQLKTMS